MSDERSNNEMHHGNAQTPFTIPAPEEIAVRYNALMAAIAHCEAQARLRGAYGIEPTQVRALADFYADYIQTGNAHAKTS